MPIPNDFDVSNVDNRPAPLDPAETLSPLTDEQLDKIASAAPPLNDHQMDQLAAGRFNVDVAQPAPVTQGGQADLLSKLQFERNYQPAEPLTPEGTNPQINYGPGEVSRDNPVMDTAAQVGLGVLQAGASINRKVHGLLALPGGPSQQENLDAAQMAGATERGLGEVGKEIGGVPGIRSIVSNIVGTAPELVVGSSGLPALAVSFGLGAAGSAFADAKEQDYEHPEAYALLSGVIAAGTSLIPGYKGRNLVAAANEMVNSPTWKSYFTKLVSDYATKPLSTHGGSTALMMGVQSTLQDLLNQQTINPNLTWKDIVADAASSAGFGALIGEGFGALGQAAHLSTRKAQVGAILNEFVDHINDTVLESPEMAHIRTVYQNTLPPEVASIPQAPPGNYNDTSSAADVRLRNSGSSLRPAVVATTPEGEVSASGIVIRRPKVEAPPAPEPAPASPVAPPEPPKNQTVFPIRYTETGPVDAHDRPVDDKFNLIGSPQEKVATQAGKTQEKQNVADASITAVNQAGASGDNKAVGKALDKAVKAKAKADKEQEKLQQVAEKAAANVAKQPATEFTKRVASAVASGIIEPIWGAVSGSRPTVFMKVGDGVLPFYRSSQGTGGAKKAGEWQPFFGIGNNAWIIKGDNNQIASDYNVPAVKSARKWLNENFDWPHELDTDLTYNPHLSPLNALGPMKNVGQALQHIFGEGQLEHITHENGAAGPHITSKLAKIGLVPETTNPPLAAKPAATPPKPVITPATVAAPKIEVPKPKAATSPIDDALAPIGLKPSASAYLRKSGWYSLKSPGMDGSVRVEPDKVSLINLRAHKEGGGAGSKFISQLKGAADKLSLPIETIPKADSPEKQASLEKFYASHGFVATGDAAGSWVYKKGVVAPIKLEPTMDSARKLATLTPQEFLVSAKSFNRISLPLGKIVSPAEVDELIKLREKVNQRIEEAKAKALASAEESDKNTDEIKAAALKAKKEADLSVWGTLSTMPQFYTEAIRVAQERFAKEAPKVKGSLVVKPEGALPKKGEVIKVGQFNVTKNHLGNTVLRVEGEPNNLGTLKKLVPEALTERAILADLLARDSGRKPLYWQFPKVLRKGIAKVGQEIQKEKIWGNPAELADAVVKAAPKTPAGEAVANAIQSGAIAHDLLIRMVGEQGAKKGGPEYIAATLAKEVEDNIPKYLQGKLLEKTRAMGAEIVPDELWQTHEVTDERGQVTVEKTGELKSPEEINKNPQAAARRVLDILLGNKAASMEITKGINTTSLDAPAIGGDGQLTGRSSVEVKDPSASGVDETGFEPESVSASHRFEDSDLNTKDKQRYADIVEEIRQELHDGNTERYEEGVKILTDVFGFKRSKAESFIESDTTLLFPPKPQDNANATLLGSLEGESPMVLSGPRWVLNPDYLRARPVDGFYNVESFFNALKNKLDPAEWQTYVDAGIKDRFRPTKIAEAEMPWFRREIATWMKDNGPRVEVRTGSNEKATTDAIGLPRIDEAIDRELVNKQVEIEHALDGIFPNFNGRYLERPNLANDVEAAMPHWKVNAEGEAAIRTLGDRMQTQVWDYIKKFNDLQDERTRRNPNLLAPIPPQGWGSIEPQRTHWENIAPLPENQMPGYVELALTVPVNDGIEGKGGGLGVLYPSTHQFPPNTLVWVRGFMEPRPQGGKAFRVIEMQSDWAQSIRRFVAGRVQPINEGTVWSIVGKDGVPMGAHYKTKEEAIEAHSRLETSLSHPLLASYEHLGAKMALAHALKEGATSIIIDDAETAMMTERHDQGASAVKRIPADQVFIAQAAPRAGFGNEPFYTTRVIHPEYFEKGKGLDAFKLTPAPDGVYVNVKYPGEDFSDILSLDRPESNSGNRPKLLAKELADAGYGTKEGNYIPQEGGMRHHYDFSIPELLRELTGYSGEKVELGEHKEAIDVGVASSQKGTYEVFRNNARVSAFGDRETAQKFLDTHGKDGANWTIRTPGKPRENLIFGEGKKVNSSGLEFPLDRIKQDEPFSLFERDKPAPGKSIVTTLPSGKPESGPLRSATEADFGPRKAYFRLFEDLGLLGNNLHGAVERVAADTTSSYSKLAKWLMGRYADELKGVKLGNVGGRALTPGFYDFGDNSVRIGLNRRPDAQTLGEIRRVVTEALMHETLHALTSRKLELLGPDSPEYQQLERLRIEAIKQLPPEARELMAKIQKIGESGNNTFTREINKMFLDPSTKDLMEQHFDTIYALLDPHEFITGVYTSPALIDFLTRSTNAISEAPAGNLWQRVKKWVMDVLHGEFTTPDWFKKQHSKNMDDSLLPEAIQTIEKILDRPSVSTPEWYEHHGEMGILEDNPIKGRAYPEIRNPKQLREASEYQEIPEDEQRVMNRKAIANNVWLTAPDVQAALKSVPESAQGLLKSIVGNRLQVLRDVAGKPGANEASHMRDIIADPNLTWDRKHEITNSVTYNVLHFQNQARLLEKRMITKANAFLKLKDKFEKINEVNAHVQALDGAIDELVSDFKAAVLRGKTKAVSVDHAEQLTRMLAMADELRGNRRSALSNFMTKVAEKVDLTTLLTSRDSRELSKIITEAFPPTDETAQAVGASPETIRMASLLMSHSNNLREELLTMKLLKDEATKKGVFAINEEINQNLRDQNIGKIIDRFKNQTVNLATQREREYAVYRQLFRDKVKRIKTILKLADASQGLNRVLKTISFKGLENLVVDGSGLQRPMHVRLSTGHFEYTNPITREPVRIGVDFEKEAQKENWQKLHNLAESAKAYLAAPEGEHYSLPEAAYWKEFVKNSAIMLDPSVNYATRKLVNANYDYFTGIRALPFVGEFLRVPEYEVRKVGGLAATNLIAGLQALSTIDSQAGNLYRKYASPIALSAHAAALAHNIPIEMWHKEVLNPLIASRQTTGYDPMKVGKTTLYGHTILPEDEKAFQVQREFDRQLVKIATSGRGNPAVLFNPSKVSFKAPGGTVMTRKVISTGADTMARRLDFETKDWASQWATADTIAKKIQFLNDHFEDTALGHIMTIGAPDYGIKSNSEYLYREVVKDIREGRAVTDVDSLINAMFDAQGRDPDLAPESQKSKGYLLGQLMEEFDKIFKGVGGYHADTAKHDVGALLRVVDTDNSFTAARGHLIAPTTFYNYGLTFGPQQIARIHSAKAFYTLEIAGTNGLLDQLISFVGARKADLDSQLTKLEDTGISQKAAQGSLQRSTQKAQLKGENILNYEQTLSAFRSLQTLKAEFVRMLSKTGAVNDPDARQMASTAQGFVVSQLLAGTAQVTNAFGGLTNLMMIDKFLLRRSTVASAVQLGVRTLLTKGPTELLAISKEAIHAIRTGGKEDFVTESLRSPVAKPILGWLGDVINARIALHNHMDAYALAPAANVLQDMKALLTMPGGRAQPSNPTFGQRWSRRLETALGLISVPFSAFAPRLVDRFINELTVWKAADIEDMLKVNAARYGEIRDKLGKRDETFSPQEVFGQKRANAKQDELFRALFEKERMSLDQLMWRYYDNYKGTQDKKGVSFFTPEERAAFQYSLAQDVNLPTVATRPTSGKGSQSRNFMGLFWGFPSWQAAKFTEYLSRASTDKNTFKYVPSVMAAGLALAAMGAASIKVTKEIKDKLYGEKNSYPDIFEAKNPADAIQALAVGAFGFVPFLGNLVNGMILNNGVRNGFDVNSQFVMLNLANDIFATGKRIIQTHDGIHPMEDFMRRWSPLARIVVNRLPNKEGLTEYYNLAREAKSLAAPGMETKKRGGGAVDATPVTPMLQDMVNAAYKGDGGGFMQAAQDYVAYKRGQGVPDNVAWEELRSSWRSRHPFVATFGRMPTEGEQAIIYANATPSQKAEIDKANNVFTTFGDMIGTNFNVTGKNPLERGTAMALPGGGASRAAVSSGVLQPAGVTGRGQAGSPSGVLLPQAGGAAIAGGVLGSLKGRGGKLRSSGGSLRGIGGGGRSGGGSIRLRKSPMGPSHHGLGTSKSYKGTKLRGSLRKPR